MWPPRISRYKYFSVLVEFLHCFGFHFNFLNEFFVCLRNVSEVLISTASRLMPTRCCRSLGLSTFCYVPFTFHWSLEVRLKSFYFFLIRLFINIQARRREKTKQKKEIKTHKRYFKYVKMSEQESPLCGFKSCLSHVKHFFRSKITKILNMLCYSSATCIICRLSVFSYLLFIQWFDGATS